MAWFPWAQPPARSNLTTGEVVDWLRYRAIEFGAPSAFIDALDDLVLAETAREEIDELQEKLNDAEDMIARIRREMGASVSEEARIEAIQDILDED